MRAERSIGKKEPNLIRRKRRKYAGCHPAQLPRRNRLIAGGKEESLLGEDSSRGLNRRRGLVVLVALVALDRCASLQHPRARTAAMRH